MTDFSDLKGQIQDWANRQDWSDQLVTSFIRMAERKFNAELRIREMIRFLEALVISRCAPLPDDWLELSEVKVENKNVPDGFAPIQYKPRHEFFSLPQRWTVKYYTIEAGQIFFGGTPDAVDGRTFKISYYGQVPIFADLNPSWLYTKYPDLYLTACLSWAALHAVGEEQSAVNFKQLTEDTIAKLNAAWLRAKASGSRLNRSKVRSFG